MENIIAATSSGMPAINGSPAEGTNGGTTADGLFGALVANELTGNAVPGGKGQKTSTGDDSIQNNPMLMAALMQYGNLFGILPAQDGTVPQTQGNAAQADTVTAQASEGTRNIQQFASRQGGQAGFMSLMAARLLANSPNAPVTGTDAGTTATGAAAQTQSAQGMLAQGTQGAQEFQSLLQTMGATGTKSPDQSQIMQHADPAASPAPAPQNGLEALEDIKQLFVSLIDAGQEAAPAQQTAAATEQTASAALQTASKMQTASVIAPSAIQVPAKSVRASEPGTAPKPDGTVQTLQALLDAIAPEGAEDSAQSNTQAGAGQGEAGTGPSLAKLPEKAQPALAAKPEAAAEGKKEPVGFSEAYRAAHSQTAQAAPAPAQEGKQAAARKTSSAEAFDSIVDKISSMQNSSQKEMEISLKPDFLGKVVIKLSMGDDGGLIAKITASNPKVQDAFMSQAATLQSSLAGQGLKDVRVVVTSTAVADAALQQQAANGGQSRREQEKKHNPVVVQALGGATAAGQPLLAYEQAYRTGSVNCLA